MDPLLILGCTGLVYSIFLARPELVKPVKGYVTRLIDYSRNGGWVNATSRHLESSVLSLTQGTRRMSKYSWSGVKGVLLSGRDCRPIGGILEAESQVQ